MNCNENTRQVAGIRMGTEAGRRTGPVWVIPFKQPGLEDKEWFDELAARSDYRGCEYNFTNIYAWSDTFSQEIARIDHFLMVRVRDNKGCSYLFPAGSGDVRPVLRELIRESMSRCRCFKLIGVTETTRGMLEKAFPGRFRYQEDRNSWDYLYRADKLAELPGKKLHAKRTHINRFVEQYPEWSFEPITAANLEECYAMHREWNRLNNGEDGSGDEIALKKVFDHYEQLKLDGGLLRAGGRCVGFTMGERLSSDTYDTHFEKAFASVQGAYAMINREFARMIREKYPEVVYINREDDLGLEGLRRAKLSYEPDGMVEKFSAILDSEHMAGFLS